MREGIASIFLPEVSDQEIDLSWLIDARYGIVGSFLSLQVELDILADHQAEALVLIGQRCVWVSLPNLRTYSEELT